MLIALIVSSTLEWEYTGTDNVQLQACAGKPVGVVHLKGPPCTSLCDLLSGCTMNSVAQCDQLSGCTMNSSPVWPTGWMHYAFCSPVWPTEWMHLLSGCIMTKLYSPVWPTEWMHYELCSPMWPTEWMHYALCSPMWPTEWMHYALCSPTWPTVWIHYALPTNRFTEADQKADTVSELPTLTYTHVLDTEEGRGGHLFLNVSRVCMTGWQSLPTQAVDENKWHEPRRIGQKQTSTVVCVWTVRVVRWK